MNQFAEVTKMVNGDAMDKKEVWISKVKDILDSCYSAGYCKGKEDERERVGRLRAYCAREAGGNDEEYAEGWGDHTPFYGWCTLCKKPHSGRWAHVWRYCPWCGAEVLNTERDPYPTGLKDTSRLMQNLLSMIADINPVEIKSHKTESSLKGWCEAWNWKMKRLLEGVLEGSE